MTQKTAEEIQKCKKFLIQNCQGMERQVNLMNDEDIVQLYEAAHSQNQASNQNQLEPVQNKKQQVKEKPRHRLNFSQREKIKELIIKKCPEYQKDVQCMSDKDLFDIYKAIKSQRDQLKVQVNQVKNKKKQLRKKVMKNGQINTQEMKNILIQRMPNYRNQINKLKDEDIKKMFQQKMKEIQYKKRGKNLNNSNEMQKNPQSLNKKQAIHKNVQDFFRQSQVNDSQNFHQKINSYRFNFQENQEIQRYNNRLKGDYQDASLHYATDSFQSKNNFSNLFQSKRLYSQKQSRNNKIKYVYQMPQNESFIQKQSKSKNPQKKVKVSFELSEQQMSVLNILKSNLNLKMNIEKMSK